MNAQELETYLYERIPLSAAMQVSVAEATLAHVRLRAPLEPNLNHAGTAFGGSIATLATLAGWSVMRLLTDHIQPTPRLVIHRSQIEYTAPITGAFEAHASAPSRAECEKFLQQLSLKGKARLCLEVRVTCNNMPGALLKGDFVAMSL